MALATVGPRFGATSAVARAHEPPGRARQPSARRTGPPWVPLGCLTLDSTRLDSTGLGRIGRDRLSTPWPHRHPTSLRAQIPAPLSCLVRSPARAACVPSLLELLCMSELLGCAARFTILLSWALLLPYFVIASASSLRLAFPQADGLCFPEWQAPLPSPMTLMPLTHASTL